MASSFSFSDEHYDRISSSPVASRLSISFWFAPVGKGELFDIDFKVHCLFAIFRRVLMRGEMALYKQHCPFGNGPLNGFRLVAPGITIQPDGYILHAALRVDGKRELRMWRAIFCYS